LRAVDEGTVPASASVTSRLFVLPVAARRWVSTDNRRRIGCCQTPVPEKKIKLRWPMETKE
jgi:hypothetical protein